MTRKRKAIKKSRAVSEKAPKTYRLSPRKIDAARRILGAPTATAAIEQALDMVVFRKEIVAGTAALYGVEIESFDS
ncbi:MAG: hypothetical protein ACREOK_01675 [Gemmatimonadaceae bacterium]